MIAVDVKYRESFLRDLKKLKKHSTYPRIFVLAFETLPSAGTLSEISNVKPVRGHPHRFRIRVGDHRIGISVHGSEVELVRVLDRRDFYRHFP